MFRAVNRRHPATRFPINTRRTGIWFAPVMGVLFVAFLAFTPVVFEERHGETLFVLSIISSSLILALILTGALFHVIESYGGWSDVDARLNDILNALRRAISLGSCSALGATSAIEVAEAAPEWFLTAPDDGYLQQVDYRALSEAAARSSSVIRLLSQPGDFVLKGSSIASLYFTNKNLPSDHLLEKIRQRFSRAVTVTKKRSIKYDANYAIVQITGIAALCMSPSFADPVAALSCINAVTVALREILSAPPKSQIHCDSKGQPRIFDKDVSPERVLSCAFDPLRPIVKNSVALTVCLLQAISALAPFLNTPAQFLELRAQAQLIRDSACLEASVRDRSAIDEAYLSARQSLACPSRIVEKIPPRLWQRPGLSHTAS